MTIIEALVKLRNDLKLWVANNLRTKVDKEDGKGLSSNDFTTTEKNKLAGIAEGANKTVVDTALSSSSTNPVQNKVVNTAISDLKTLVGDDSVSTQIENAISKKSDTGHNHNDTYYTEGEIDTKLAGKANSSHGNHVPATETANNTKFLRNDNTWATVTPANIGAAAASHGTHVSYGTSATAVGATAGAGSASTVSRSDHTHSLSKSAVTTALGYTPPTQDTNTTYDLAASTSSTNGNVKINLTAGGSGSGTDSVTVKGSGATTVTTDANGVITISSTDNNTTYGVVSTTADGLAPKRDGSTTKFLRGDGTWAVPPDTNTTYTALKNPNSLTVQGNGTTSFTYDGSAAKTLNIKAGSNVSVSSDTSGNVTISATDTNTVYTHPSYTARTGVPTANATLAHGGTFTVTQPVCDATGHITQMNTRTYTLPADNDTKVTNTLATTTKAYVTGTTSASTNTGTQVFDTGVYLDTTAGRLTVGSIKVGSALLTYDSTNAALKITF